MDDRFHADTWKQTKEIGVRNGGFLVLSGLATGASWLCFYRALQEGPASLVVPIDKLSILFTVLFAVLIFRERMSERSWLGLTLLVIGTLIPAVTIVECYESLKSMHRFTGTWTP